MIATLRVVVLTYGKGGAYEQLLAALRREGVSLERVLVVHNPSVPGERPPPLPAGCEVVLASHNLGYAAGMNLGIERQLQRDCELLLLLTHDACFAEGALRRLLLAAAENPGYGALGPALFFPGGEPFSFGGLTSPGGVVSHRHLPPAAANGVAPCDWIDGGTMLLRRSALAGGGFDEALWSYFEDADLCLRISRRGLGVGVVVAARAEQEPGGAKRRGPWAYLLARNGLAYGQRFAGARGALTVAAHLLLAASREAARTLVRRLNLRPGEPAETAAAMVGTLRGLADFLRHRWGPPPADLPGGGDIGNVAPPV